VAAPGDERDEFDVEGFASHRSGAHRARPGVLARWGPTVLTVATVVALGVVVVAALVLLGTDGVADLVSRGWGAVTSSGPTRGLHSEGESASHVLALSR